MKKWFKALAGVAALGGSASAHAGSWSAQDYDLYPGDFNGDGLTDMLYVAHDQSHLNGIVLSDGTGLNITLQTWGNAYLGIPWSSGKYNVLVADFNGDGKADVVLQRKTPGDHYLLLTEEGGVGAISQTIAQNTAGLVWSANAHRIVAGDFNGDGKADLFFQATDPKGLNAIVLADGLGQFSASAPDQSWNDGYAGLYWAQSEANIYAADFNGDRLSDLLVQGLPLPGTGPGTNQPAQFEPNRNGVVMSQAANPRIAVESLQAWSRDGFGADWSPLLSKVVTGDFNGDGRADVLLQGQTANNPSYLLYGRASGAAFTKAATLGSSTGQSADTYILLAGQFAVGKANGLYAQSPNAGQTNQLLAVGQTALTVTIPDASFPSAAATGAAAPASGSFAAAALLANTSAGRTAGQFAVSAMGAATYKIPIWTPPGARGIQPKLALVYTSGSPDGMMGPGWSLSGLSSVARCNKTYADNGGAPSAVTLTMSDDFCLDGNRLRATSGAYGASGTQYQTEIANFSRVTSYLTAGNGPSYFIVEGKDGLYYEYGNTVDSKAYANGGSTPYSWMLNKIRDRQGNNLVVVYSTISGSVQPSTIQYTQTPSTNGTTYPYTVSFAYQNRVTSLDRYVAGGDIQQTQVLSKINVQASGVSVRQFNMTYATAPATVRDRLTTIQECGGSAGTDCLRATNITYQNGASGISAPTTPSGSGAMSTSTLRTADIDGDGRDDLVFATTSGSTNSWWVQFATATGFAAPTSVGASGRILIDDFLGLGRSCLLAPVGANWSSYCWNAASNAFVVTATGVSATATTTVDFDGDGLADLAYMGAPAPAVNPTYVPIMYQRNTSSGGNVAFAAATAVSSISYSINAQVVYALYGNGDFRSSNVRRMDFDGDGRGDLLVYEYIVIPIPPQTYTYIGSVSMSGGGSSFGSAAAFGNFAPVSWNDDGCTDLQVESYIQLSRCNGSVTTGFALPSLPRLFADWDGDGRTDAFANVGGSWQVYRSLGTGVATGVSTGIAASAGTWTPLEKNGDGLADFAVANSSSGNAVYYGVHNGASLPADLATNFTDGWGVSASPSYVPITQGSYTAYPGAVYPEVDVMAPIYVVSSAQQSDGLGGTYANAFSYWGAKAQLGGRGFLGFYWTLTTDSRNDLYNYIYYKRSFPYTGTVFERITYRGTPWTMISDTVNTFNVTDLGGVGCAPTTTSSSTRCFPYLANATTYNYELNSSALVQTSVATFSYDTNGNALTSQTQVTDNDAASPTTGAVWSSLTTNTYGSVNTTTWCLDKPTRTTTQNSITGQTAQSRTVDHAVDATACRYTSEAVEPLSPTLKAVTTFGYDTCGNVNSVGVVGLDQNGVTMPTRTTTSSYGTRCTFPETVTNALSQTSSTAYNYSFGVKASSTDANGVAVSWLYDSFGRRTRENRPDSTFTTWLYEDCLTVGVSCAPTLGSPTTDFLRFKVTETRYAPGTVYVTSGITYADGLERVRYSAGYRVLGTLTWSKVNYDTLGRKVDSYQPYSSASNGYHHIEYDLLNRPTFDRLYNASGVQDRFTHMVYAGNKTTLTDARGNSTTKWMDVAGKLRRIIDPAPGGTTNYTFDSFGNLSQIADAKMPTGAVTTYTYNVRGFKVDSVDPDTGHWVYTPNSLNELVKQTDAKNQVTQFGYDLLGRMTSRLEPESATPTTWTYGTSALAHNIGRLQSVSKPDGYAESYVYDGLGRPSSKTITEDTNYTISQAYSTIGAIDTVTYPASTGSPFVLKHVYSYGALQQVKDNVAGTVFWSLNSVNDSSLPLSEVLGGIVTVASTYTPWTNDLVTRKEGSGGGTNNLQDLGYQWDLNGNLLQRQDNKQGLTEVFVHDTLNRISSSTLNSITNLTVNYDEAGNITSKSDVGSYDYTTAQSGCTYQSYLQPHAVRKVGTAVYCYDANGNVTSRQGGAIAWTSYNLPSSIAYSGNSTTFNYNSSHQRWKQVANYGASQETTYYIGGLMEKVVRPTGITEYRHMIPAGSNSAILTRRSDSSSSTYYMTSDHQGSGDLVLDSAGTILAKESFTPFGARRGSNWQGIPTAADYTVFSNTSRRGFTGHEMLDSVGLVHMNGRVYDPTIGRFLTADPIIQTLSLSQAINPYSYVMNIPLALIDPSGYSWLSKLFSWIGHHIGKIVLAVIGFVTAGPVGLLAALALPEKDARILASIGLAIMMPMMGFTGFWGTVATGAVSGGVATGSLHGAIVGAITAGFLHGAGRLAGKVAQAMSGPITSTPMDTFFGVPSVGGAPSLWASTGVSMSDLETVTITAHLTRWEKLLMAASRAAGYVSGAANYVKGLFNGPHADVWTQQSQLIAMGPPAGRTFVTISGGEGGPGFVSSVTPAERAQYFRGQMVAVAMPVGAAVGPAVASYATPALVSGSMAIGANGIITTAEIAEVAGASTVSAAEAFAVSTTARFEAQALLGSELVFW